MYTYKAVIKNIVDGDTYDVDIDLGFHIHIHERVRILDLDTPECRGKEKNLGLICKQFAIENFMYHSIILQSKEEIQEPKTDNFGRWLCRIFLDNPEKEEIAKIFSQLGCNKLRDNYKEECVLRLKETFSSF